MSAEQEEWRPIAGYETIYHISNLGRIKRIIGGGHGKRPGQIMKVHPDRGGYLFVTLTGGVEGKRSCTKVHKLVAEHFVGPRPEGNHINHIDGVKAHNWAMNLEYVTRQENMEHASEHNLLRKGEEHPQHRLTEDQVREIRHLVFEKGMPKRHVAELFGVTEMTVHKIIRGKTWRHVA